ncbi:hypothetical protein AWENTII_000014 [Aspergillus wentii]
MALLRTICAATALLGVCHAAALPANVQRLENWLNDIAPSAIPINPSATPSVIPSILPFSSSPPASPSAVSPNTQPPVVPDMSNETSLRSDACSTTNIL